MSAQTRFPICRKVRQSKLTDVKNSQLKTKYPSQINPKIGGQTAHNVINPKKRLENKANAVRLKQKNEKIDSISRIETTFEKDISKLIELSKEFQKSCIEELKEPHTNVKTGSATVSNRSCITNKMRGKCNRSENIVNDTKTKITADHLSLHEFVLGDSVVPPIFDEHLMKEYGSRLIDIIFDNPFIVNEAYRTINSVPNPSKSIIPEDTITRIVANKQKTPANNMKSSRNTSSRSVPNTNRSETPQTAALINEKSRRILESIKKKGGNIKKHSCITKISRSVPKQPDTSRDKEKYLSQYYDFGKIHPHLKLVESDTVIPRRETKTDSTDLYLPLETPIMRPETKNHLTLSTTSSRKSKQTGTVETWHQIFSIKQQREKKQFSQEDISEKRLENDVSKQITERENLWYIFNSIVLYIWYIL